MGWSMQRDLRLWFTARTCKSPRVEISMRTPLIDGLGHATARAYIDCSQKAHAQTTKSSTLQYAHAPYVACNKHVMDKGPSCVGW